jgi:hypothetical protein
MTEKNIRDAVRILLAEASASRWTDLTLDGLINFIQSHFSINAGVLVTYDNTTIATLAGTLAYDLPAACAGEASILAVFYDDDPLDPSTPEAETRVGGVPHDTSDTDTPANWFTVVETSTGHLQLALNPVPDAVKAVTLWYAREAQPMAVATDAAICEIPAQYKLALAWGTAWLAWETLKEFERANRCKDAYFAEIKKARAHVAAMVAAAIKRRDTTVATVFGQF